MILGDSNTQHLQPEKMTQRVTIRRHPCYTMEEVSQAVVQGHTGDITILHAGTNDIKTKEAHEIVNNIAKTVSTLRSQKGKVVISSLLPREGLNLNKKIGDTNELLKTKFKGQDDIYITDTSDFYYYDRPNRELYRQQYQGDRRLPLLHLNRQGLIMLSKELQRGIRKLNVST